jgi:ferredoxin
MEILKISQKDFREYVSTYINNNIDVIGVISKEDKYVYEKLSDINELCLDFDETQYSPKAFLFPYFEPILKFKQKNPLSYKPILEENKQVIIGIHPCDLAAIALLDKAFSLEKPDSHYLTRRNNTTLIGIYPTKQAKYRFTSSMIKDDEPYLAADAFLIDLQDGNYVIEIVSDKGKEFFSKSKAIPAKEKDEAKANKLKKIIKDNISLSMSREELVSFLAGKENHSVWKELGEKCFSCGSCVMVCPTCYCFDVLDDVDLSLKNGIRYRTWDACVLEPFAVCAGGHNFRKNASDRIRHRLYRKQVFLFNKFGLAGCVGCGRCKKACVPDIAFPPDIDNKILEKES